MALAFTAGIGIGVMVSIPVAVWGALGGACIVAGWRWAAQRPRWTGVCLLVAATACGAMRMAEARALPPDHIGRSAPVAWQPVTLVGWVAADPQWEATPGGAVRVTSLVAVEAVRDAAGEWRRACGLSAITIHRARTALRYGDRLLLQGRWRRPPPAANPGQFDPRAYWRSRGVAALVRATEEDVALLEAGGGGWLPRWTFRVKAHIRRTFRRHLTPPRGALLDALLLGDRVALPESIRDAFLKTGTVHILAVSGLNVAPLAAVIGMVLLGCRVPRRMRHAAIVGLLVVYAILTGARPSIVRSVIMLGLWSLGVIIERESSIANALALAAILILAWQPWAFGDPGFILSFGSLVAILLIQPMVQRRWDEPSVLDRLAARLSRAAAIRLQMRRAVWALAAVSLAVWVGLWPLVARYFGLVTPITLLANLLIVPLVPLVLALGCAVAVAGAICDWSGALFGASADVAVGVLIGAAMWLARVPGAWCPVPTPPWWLVVVYYAGLMAWLGCQRRSGAIGRVAVIVVLTASLGIVGVRPLPSSDLRVHCFDLRQGEAALVRLPDGRHLLINAGQGGWADEGRRVIVPALRALGVRRLEAIVLLGADAGRISGLPAVLDAYPVRCVYEVAGDESTTTSTTSRRSRQAIARHRIPHTILEDGDRLTFGDVALEVASSSLQLSHGNVSVLLGERVGKRPIVRVIGAGGAEDTPIVIGDEGGAVMIRLDRRGLRWRLWRQRERRVVAGVSD